MSNMTFDIKRRRQEIEALRHYIADRQARKATPQGLNPFEQQFEQQHPGYSQKKVGDLKEELAHLKKSAQADKRVHFGLQSTFDDALEAIRFAYQDKFGQEAKDYKTKDGRPGIELSFKSDVEAKAFFTEMAKEHNFIVKDSKGTVLYRAHNGILKDVPQKTHDARFMAEKQQGLPGADLKTASEQSTTPSLTPA
tara:strand:+ start:172 stop:756 length:585 start_codon:yes stop_codon:yes gene_type:complete